MVRSIQNDLAELRPRSSLYSEARWYACYTRARHEKRVHSALHQSGIETYLPLVPLKRRSKGRQSVVLWPLFPSYVFSRFTLSQYHAILSVSGVATVVRSNGVPAPIHEGELDNVRRFAVALARAGVEPREHRMFKAGDRVRVTSGPFSGVEGMVREARGRRCIFVTLAALGRSFAVDIGASMLAPVEPVQVGDPN
jgi:transcription antitermination factor NusG